MRNIRNIWRRSRPQLLSNVSFLHPRSDVSDILDRLTFCKAEVRRFEENRARAAMARARVRWAESGEKSTRYFFQLEKSKFKESVLDCIQIGGDLVYDQKRIREEIGNFFLVFTLLSLIPLPFFPSRLFSNIHTFLSCLRRTSPFWDYPSQSLSSLGHFSLWLIINHLA